MKTLLLLITVLLIPFTIHAQSSGCDGNLGENILKNGDFGAGMMNVPEKPDELISAYVYVWQAPPPSGYYLLTNNTGAWNYLYPTWMAMGDKSDDSNGYFMVVNGDGSPGRFYEQIIDDLCENTQYTFSVDIINIVKANASNQNLPNIFFLLNEEKVLSTGSIQQNERWNSYSFTFTTGIGETSIRLSLKNNALGEPGNDFALDNFSLRACGPVAEIQPSDTTFVCENSDPIDINATIFGEQSEWFLQWQRSLEGINNWENLFQETDNFYPHDENTPGNYSYRYLLANSISNLNNPNCRINSDIAVVNVSSNTYFLKETICEGSGFSIGNSVYTQAGTYTESLVSSIGCDSIITLDLTVAPNSNLAATIDYKSPTCAARKDGIIEIVKIENGILPYSIQINNAVLENDFVLDSIGAGFYDLLIKDSVGCSFSQSIELIDPKAFILDIDQRLEINLGEKIVILPIVNQSVRQFFWEDDRGIACDTCSALSLRPIESKYYTLTAISEATCNARDSVFVKVNSVGKLYIPSAFSPNNDGKNDYFSIFANRSNVQEILQFSIFDRWGNIVFEQQNISAKDAINIWDGYVGGKRVASGTYACFAKIKLLDGSEKVISQQLMVVD